MTQVGFIYGEALYRLCQEVQISDAVLRQLDVLEESFRQTPEFVRLLRCHALTKAERCCILDRCFANLLQPYLLHFLKLLTQKGYIRHFPNCCAVYRDLYNRAHNILRVTVTTPLSLTQAQKKRLSDVLSLRSGKTVHLNERVDAAVLGGVRLDYDGKRLDGTLANRLDNIRSLLNKTVL